MARFAEIRDHEKKRTNHELVAQMSHHFGRKATRALIVGWLVLTTNCMRTVQIGDKALRPFDAMYSVDRAQYGFTPLPKSGSVSIEGKSAYNGYDAMLHFSGTPSRTVAFRWDGKTYQWLGEQEVFEGPKTYESPDGTFHERVTISFYRERMNGGLKGLTIDYWGPDERLKTLAMGREPNWSLTLSEVEPLLTNWGYRTHQ